VHVNLTYEDMNELRDRHSPALARNIASTFISFRGTLISDSAHNEILATGNCTAIAARIVISDVTPPTIVSVDLDLSTRVLTASYSECVLASSVNVASFSIVDSSLGSPSVSLTTSTSYRLTLDVIAFNLSAVDFNNVMRSPVLGRSAVTSHISVAANGVGDAFGNPIAFIAAVDPATFVADLVPPRITSFDLNMNQGRIFLAFDEVVDITSFSATDIQVSGLTNVGISLSLNSTAVSDINDTTLVVAIGRTDLNKLKLDTTVAVSGSSTYISVGSSTIRDVSGNSNDAILSVERLSVQSFVADTTPPVLHRAALDVDLGQLTLAFDEPIVTDNLNFESVRLQDSALAFVSAEGEATNSFFLTGGSTASPFGTTVVVDLTRSDLNTLKRLRGLGTRPEDTFISFAEGTFSDLAGNRVDAVADGSAFQAHTILDDVTAPTLQGFDFLMSIAGPPLSLRLSFSETVDLESFDVTKVVLQSKQTKDSDTKQLRLSGGSSQPVGS
jgi:hypothetical protein